VTAVGDKWDEKAGKGPRMPKLAKRTWALLGAGAALVVLVLSSLHTVDAGERAVVFHRDGSLTVLQPGKFQFVVPILNSVTVYNVQSQLAKDTAEGISKDLQVVKTEVAVLYHPDAGQIQAIHQSLGPDYADRVIPPSIQDAVKGAVSYFNAEELTAGTREQVKNDIVARITSDLAKQHIAVDQVSITDFDFSDQFNAATEAKVVAQQKALEARNNLERTKYEANQTIVQAQAQAEAARLLAASPNGTAGSPYLFLQWLQKWDGHLPQTMMGQDAQVLVPLPPSGAARP